MKQATAKMNENICPLSLGRADILSALCGLEARAPRLINSTSNSN